MYVTSACLINANEFMVCYLNSTSHLVIAFCVTLCNKVNNILPIPTLAKALNLACNVAFDRYIINNKHYANSLDVVQCQSC